MERIDDPEIRRGDILWISCDPSLGVEPRKTRTCVVVSNDVANRFARPSPSSRHALRPSARAACMVDLQTGFELRGPAR
jgi:mRNA-degrading endonuclease toxin of MazEF toxin-antitoxin module